MIGNWDGANVCKYFLSGRCRYGDRCRYLHTQPEAGGGRSVLQKPSDNFSQSNYYSGQSYSTQHLQPKQQNQNYYQSKGQDYSQDQGRSYRSQSPAHQSQNYRNQGQSPNYSPQQSYSRKSQDDPESPAYYMYSISEYCSLIERHGMWPFTSFGFLAGHGSLPGWEDYAPEEIRWAFYRARAEGTLPTLEATLRELTKKAYGLRLIFLKPGKVAESILDDYLKQKVDLHNLPQTPNIFESMANRPPPPSSNFSFSVAQQNPFQTNTFQPTTPQWSQPNFGSVQTPQPANTPNIFNISQPNTFTPPQTNIFGQVSFKSVPLTSETMEMEGAVQEARPPQENIFGRISTPFGAPSSTGGNSIFGGVSAPSGDSSYSTMSDLSPDDLEQFKATKFTMDKLPLVPPPKELCGFT